MARLQVVRGKYVYVTVWLPSRKARRRIYLGAFGDDPLKLLLFRSIFEGGWSGRDLEALRLDLKHYIENTVDPETRMTKTELAINWALTWYYNSRDPIAEEDLEKEYVEMAR